MLSLSLCSKFYYTALNHFEECLLYTLMTWVSGNGVVFTGFSG